MNRYVSKGRCKPKKLRSSKASRLTGLLRLSSSDLSLETGLDGQDRTLDATKKNEGKSVSVVSRRTGREGGLDTYTRTTSLAVHEEDTVLFGEEGIGRLAGLAGDVLD